MKGIYSEELACEWISWTAISPGEMHLKLPANNCTDMGGATRLAEKLNPSVTKVVVFSESKKDIEYLRTGKYTWFAK